MVTKTELKAMNDWFAGAPNLSELSVKKTVWVCGCWIHRKPQLVGVYSSESKAVDQCKNCMYWVGPIELDKAGGDIKQDWPGCYYPKPHIPHGEFPRDLKVLIGLIVLACIWILIRTFHII